MYVIMVSTQAAMTEDAVKRGIDLHDPMVIDMLEELQREQERDVARNFRVFGHT